MEAFFQTHVFWGAVVIFLVRVLNIALDTLRVLFVMRGQRVLAWVVGFIVSLLYVLLLTSVLSNLSQPAYIVAYAAGFATGSVVGMWLEEKMALGFKVVQIVSPGNGTILATLLREKGFGVTEIPARGRDGAVTMLNVGARRRDMDAVQQLVREVDPNAFITEEDVRPVRRGVWRK